MKLKNILLVVNDIERSKAFYKELFGLSVIRDFGENVILTEGLVLQEKKVWEHAINKEVQTSNHAFELYFREPDLDGFMKKIKESKWEIVILNQFPDTEQMQEEMQDSTTSVANRCIRFYDPDGHVIEVGE